MINDSKNSGVLETRGRIYKTFGGVFRAKFEGKLICTLKLCFEGKPWKGWTLLFNKHRVGKGRLVFVGNKYVEHLCYDYIFPDTRFIFCTDFFVTEVIQITKTISAKNTHQIPSYLVENQVKRFVFM